jgi:hypothetical protein
MATYEDSEGLEEFAGVLISPNMHSFTDGLRMTNNTWRQNANERFCEITAGKFD